MTDRSLALFRALRPVILGAALGLIPLHGLRAEVDPIAGVLMTADEFEAYATGKTLTYAEGGEVYGAEEYLPNRRVRWAFTQDVCKFGHWYAQTDHDICFVYNEPDDPQCWRFFKTAQGGLKAQFMDEFAQGSLDEVSQSSTPLACAGPDVGV